MKNKIATARERHGKPFLHEVRKARVTPKSRLLKEIEKKSRVAGTTCGKVQRGTSNEI